MMTRIELMIMAKREFEYTQKFIQSKISGISAYHESELRNEIDDTNTIHME